MHVDWLKKLSTDLGLEEYQQDWGICNSDPNRIQEFIRYFENNIVEHPYEPEALAELILQSYEELEETGPEIEKDFGLIVKFIEDHGAEFPMTLNYWRKLDGEEWQLPSLLNKILA